MGGKEPAILDTLRDKSSSRTNIDIEILWRDVQNLKTKTRRSFKKRHMNSRVQLEFLFFVLNPEISGHFLGT